MKNSYGIMLLLVLGCLGCDSTSEQMKESAKALEARLVTTPTKAVCDSLTTLYREMAKANPEDHTANLGYLTRAAEVQLLYNSDAAPSARWLFDALAHHAEGQNLTETISVLAQIWNSNNYKAAASAKMGPDDIDNTRLYLQKNQVWMDSALIRLDKKMEGGLNVEKTVARKFIEIAEAYASITDSPDKYADLLMKAAGLAKNTGEFNKSLQLYFKLSNRLPDHPQAKTALFMQAFIYENDLHDLNKAKTTYEEFLQKYPNDPDYADDAKIALQTLGKSPEEMLKSFK